MWSSPGIRKRIKCRRSIVKSNNRYFIAVFSQELEKNLNRKDNKERDKNFEIPCYSKL